jgi:tetratricopeptide (TPR) repeat protein
VDKAQKYFEQALEWNAGNLDAWGGAVDQLIQTQDYTDAEKLSLAFLEKNPNSLTVLRTLARNIYFPQGRFDEAIVTMQQVLNLAPSDPSYWEDLRVMAVLLAQVGRIQEALPLAQQSLEAAPQEQKASIQPLIDQLQAQLGISPQPTGTLPFQPLQ